MAKETELPEGEGEQLVAPEEQQEQQEEVQQEAEEIPDPVEGIASELGWVPKEKFKGKEEDWKPAADFIREGKNIQKGLSRDLKEVRNQMETMARTSATILQDRLTEERSRLAQQYQQAVDDGDPDKTWQISNRIRNVDSQLQQAQSPNAPPSESVDWVARNPWFNTNPVARAVALQTAQIHADAGKGTAEQLHAAEEEVRRAYPNLFANGKPAPSVSSPGSRSAQLSTKAKTFADMPKAAQDVAKDMVERGVIPDTEVYARNYFASEGKAR